MHLVAVAILVGAAIGVVPAGSSCQGSDQWTYCDTTNSGTAVDISGGKTRPGTRPGNSDHYPDPARPPAAVPEPDPGEEDCGPLGCRGGYEVAGFPEVTLADIASFRPAAPSLSGEPAGFGVVGMPANLVAAASEVRIPGNVLGWDVTVRFVPHSFVFDYGDGASTTTATGGATWERLGQAQFTPTATSHVYGERGSYPVSATVRYTASVDFGNDFWQPVQGFVVASAGGYDVRVVEVRTALVDETCAEDPSGPGC